MHCSRDGSWAGEEDLGVPPRSHPSADFVKRFEDLYSITRRKIGEGGFGIVCLAFDKRRKSQLACKIIDVQALQNWERERKSSSAWHRRSGESPYQHIRQEVEILFELNHVGRPSTHIVERVLTCLSQTYSVSKACFSAIAQRN